MPMAFGVSDEVAAYLRDRYGERLLSDLMGITHVQEVGELQRIVLTLAVHRERKEGET
jgi:hypothetical protein